MDLLKRALAPISDAAWSEIDEEARRVLSGSLTARRVIDIDGPHGPDYSAVGLGRLTVGKEKTAGAVRYGIHRVLPLIELRVPFELERWELDNIERGAEDAELDPLVEAAHELARFEERAIYDGFPEADIEGLRAGAEHDPISLGTDGAAYPEAVTAGLITMRQATIEGPYALVLGPTPFKALASACKGCQPRQQIDRVLEGGAVMLCPSMEGGLLLSTRGGDFQLVLGQDIAIGWESQESNKVHLFLMESFTFRLLEPRAVVPFEV